jgi:MFS transporter, DHA2 family, multidrug resistance protein
MWRNSTLGDCLQAEILGSADRRPRRAFPDDSGSVASFLEQARGVFLQQTGDPAAAQQLAWQALENLRQQQASALAYFDVFLILSMVTLALVPLVLLMKRSVAQKGAHIGGE